MDSSERIRKERRRKMKLYRPEIDNKKWYRAYCFLPQRIGDYIIWLRWIEIQYPGEYIRPNIRLIK